MDRLEEYALENNIPIMEKDGILFLQEYIKKNGVRRILEIGTAIGYSAINMALVDDDIRIVTLERDEGRYKEALRNINDFHLNERIKVVLVDALCYETFDEFDLIFIDAAKAQYIKFFERYEGNLSEDGVIITDNLNFHGLVNSDEIKSKNLRALVRKINNYREYLKNNKKYRTMFLDIGDGIALSKKN